MPSLRTIWIIHRDPLQRAALARIAAAGDNTLLGGPADRVFETAPAADCIVLGVCDDFELELDFAFRISARLQAASWILVADGRDQHEVERLFDTLSAQVLRYPPEPSALQLALRNGLSRRGAAPLSLRRVRGRTTGRFSRWFGELELPELLRAIDPRLARLPLLIRGEPGSGRGLVARYVDAQRADESSAFAKLACARIAHVDDLIAQLPAESTTGSPLTLYLEGVDQLPTTLQSLVHDWIEYGSGPLAAAGERVRWMASAAPPIWGDSERALDPGLRRAVGGVELCIPPLRQHPEWIAALAQASAAGLAKQLGLRPRRFAADALELLEHHSWPGDRAELDAVVLRTLTAGDADPIGAADLVFGDGSPSAAAPREARSAETAPPDNDATEGGEPADAEGVATRSSRHPAERVAPSAWLRLAGAVAHEVRNPLVSIRTFAELLPENYQDEDFRTRFAELVGADVRRIERVVERLQRLGEQSSASRGPVDLSALLRELLDKHASEIGARRLLVLDELEATRPLVVADAGQLRATLDTLITRALARVADEGDVYLATRHHEAGLHGEPSVRLLLRYQRTARATRVETVEGLGEDDNALEYAVAEAVVETHGGSFTADDSDPHERVVVIDLPAPM